jgi:glutamate synthase (NADPH/NADH) small chain
MRFEETRLEAAAEAGAGRLVMTGGIIEIAADAVFKAIGQGMDLAALVDPVPHDLQHSDKIHVDACFRTALPGVYAGGDCVAPGQDLTVQAVQHGKLAALAIHHDILSKAEASWPT